MGTVTIDLGVIGNGSHARDADPLRPPSRRLRDRRRPRVAGAGALAVLLSTVLTAGAPATPAMRPVLTVPFGNAVLLAEDALYVQHHRPAEDGTTLTAYRLTDGGIVWRSDGWGADLGQHPLTALQVFPGVLLATVFGDRTAMIGGPVDPPVTAFDPDTGEVRWTSEGRAVASDESGAVVALLRFRPGAGPEAPDLPSVLVGVDTATGEEVWTSQPSARWGTDFQNLDGSRHVVSLDADGRMTGHDLTTGDALVSIDVAAFTGPDRHDVNIYLSGAVVFMQRPEARALHAFDADTLTHRWTADLPAGSWRAAACGPVVCVQSPRALHALNPHTGELVWSAENAPSEELIKPWPHSLGPGHPTWLLAGDRVIDATTGAQVLPLDEWSSRGSTGMRTTQWHRDPVLTWRDRVGGSGTRTWFGRLGDDPVRIQVLGSVDGLLGCRTTTSHVACRDGDQLRVWSLR